MSKTADGIITSWNAGAETLFGYTASEAVGRPMLMLFPPERPAEEPDILARIARGESVSHFETQRVRKDGSMVDVSVSISPIRNSAGEIVGASKIARDITERRLAERKLQTQLARLDLLQRITRAAGDRQDMPSIFRVVLGRLEDQLPVDFSCVCLYDDAAARLTITTIGPASGALAGTLELEEQLPVPVDANGLAGCVAGRLIYEPDTVALPFPFPQRLARGGLRSVVLAPLRLETLRVRRAGRRAPEPAGVCKHRLRIPAAAE